MTSSASVVQPVIIEVVPAPLLRRLGAILYDALLLIAVLVGATGLAMGIVAMLAGAAAIQSDGAFTGHPLFRTYILLICFIFYGGFWVHGGQTLGLRAWRLRVLLLPFSGGASAAGMHDCNHGQSFADRLGGRKNG